MGPQTLLLIALVVAAVVAVPWPSMAQQPIRIGTSIAITGRDAVQGGYVREGYLLRQQHVNEKGGALGRPIELLIRDDGSDPKTAVGLYEKLITEDKVDAVMGPYGSPYTDAVADVTEKHRKLMVAPAAATTSIWEKGRRYLVMVLSPLEASAEGTIDLAARHGLKTIGLIGSLARPAIIKGALELAKKKGLQVVVHETFPSGTTDFSAMLNKVKAAKPDVLVVGAPHGDIVSCVARLGCIRTRTLWRARRVPRQSHVDTGLIPKPPIVGVDRLHVLVRGVPLGLHRGGVTRGGLMALFFRVSWRVSRVRCRLDRGARASGAAPPTYRHADG